MGESVFAVNMAYFGGTALNTSNQQSDAAPLVLLRSP